MRDFAADSLQIAAILSKQLNPQLCGNGGPASIGAAMRPPQHNSSPRLPLLP